MIFEILYTSELSDVAAARSVGEIVHRSRIHNASVGITGLLVFDGKRFCQLLEGDQDAVIVLCNRIEADLRHDRFRICHQGANEGPRRFSNWAMGYALDRGHDFIDSLLAVGNGAAMAEQLQKRSALLDPGTGAPAGP